MRVGLVGAGHAHLHLIGKARRLREAGLDLTLISPAKFLYSGLASAVLSGALDPDCGEIDVAALAAAHGVRHIVDRALGMDRDRLEIQLGGGGVLAFDALSFNIGSQISDPEGLASSPEVWPAKPLDALLELRPRIEAEIVLTGQCPALVVAGGGQSAHELAAALCGLCERQGVMPRIVLVHPHRDLNWAPARAGKALVSDLARRGVEFHAGRVSGRAPGHCQLADGPRLDCDHLVLATGLEGPDLAGRLGLAVDGAGRLVTTPTLQSISDERVFAVGDCAVIGGDARPCAGVFGVRAAPILLENLLALARRSPLQTYRPQGQWLSIMDLGDGKGLALWGRVWWLGALSLYLKRRLDLGFVGRIRAAKGPVQTHPSAG